MGHRTGRLEENKDSFVSKLSDLQARMASLQEIGSILNAMKNLSLVEITKISRQYLNQQELLQSVKLALADFEHFFGAVRRGSDGDAEELYVLIGSERGFCGGFNEAIQNRCARETADQANPKLIIVGRKLALKFAEDKRVAALDGPSAAEEIPGVISALAKELSKFPEKSWKIIHNSYDGEGSRVEVNSPFEFVALPVTPAFAYAPLLNVPAKELRVQIVEQFLFALFYRILYLSFTAENHERLRHMEGALNKIRDQQQRLKQLANALRQESITEELEIILMSVDC
jgi:F-type H+-transporting ATPase subunit gamma